MANEYDVAGDADVVDGSGLTTIPSVITVGNGNDTVIGMAPRAVTRCSSRRRPPVRSRLP